MDSWRQHLGFGLLFEVPFLIGMYIWKDWFNSFDFVSIFQILVILFISPLVIDLDHKHGKLREGMTFLGMMIGLVGAVGYYVHIDLTILMVMGLAISAPAFLLFYVTKHRGFVHSIPVCFIYSGLVYLLTHNYQVAILGLIGSYSHLIGDKEPFKFL